ncbi:hypothetical protein IMSHALPRED_008125 [Imshaugia aleurites]|uniref:Uncharacterized protein n=1 Tax=Imshaugia aleurites TaxID=172621 RepID=A0A8H3FVY6_9LECA|nr:hypothetical protein IMSHALPRED_008125 [Imshaugia aleurites]
MRKLDETAEKKHPYSERLFNERLGLDQFYRDRKSRKDVGAKAVEDISAKQVQLVEKLTEFITESADKPKTIGRLRLLRMRKYSEKEIKRAESFLSFLTNTNRAMRAIYAQQGVFLLAPGIRVDEYRGSLGSGVDVGGFHEDWGTGVGSRVWPLVCTWMYYCP